MTGHDRGKELRPGVVLVVRETPSATIRYQEVMNSFH